MNPLETRRRSSYDAVVVGSGPNGLAAAITLARAGRSVLVVEGQETIGGGARSAERTLPGFIHDTCSAVHPLAVASPFLRSLPLEKHGLVWIDPPAALAHPFDDGCAALMYRSIDRTIETLGRDGPAYRKLIEPWVRQWQPLFEDLLAPIHVPGHPLLMMRFGLRGMRSAVGLIHGLFKEQWARGLLAGLAAHSILPLSQAPSAAIGLVLAIAGHAVGWPIPRGGAQSISQALASYFKSLGGDIVTQSPIRSINEIPPARALFFDLTPQPLLRIAGDRFSQNYRRSLEKFRYGPAAFKLDWALSGPIPWKARECAEAGTVHLGGPLEEIIASEQAAWAGAPAEKPFVLLSQPSLFDPVRVPSGKHTVWAYCHVPRGSSFDMTERIENQIERFAPGFRDLVLARAITSPQDLERNNPNYVGGDISGGVADLRQLFFRPTFRRVPYSTSVRNWYICSASTPPGGGVHGMCGYHAAQAALKRGI